MLITPLGDAAALIRISDRADRETRHLVRAVCARLDERPPPGFVEYVPGYTSVAVHYDPAGSSSGEARSYEDISTALRDVLMSLEDVRLPPARDLEIPVCYGGELGPDLNHVADHARMEPEEVVRVHTSGDYLVHILGFVPGFAYLGGLDERIATPRRATPRARVPPSSVAIGGRQTGIYPISCPGGWHLIGRTPLRLFDPADPMPTLLQPGDRVRFRSISAEEYHSWAEPE